MQLWRYQPPWMFDEFDRLEEVFPSASYQYVLYGMGFETEVADDEIAGSTKQAARFIAENDNIARKSMQQLPRHRDLLNKIRDHGLQRI
jgi:tryptophan halogenase